MINRDGKKLNFKQAKYGVEKRNEWLEGIQGHSGFLPQSVGIKDIDIEFVNMVKTSLSPIVEYLKGGEVVKDKMPVFFLTAQRWAEFSKTWEFTNEFKDISLPFMTIVRNTDVQVGTNQNGYFNVPGRRNWTYYKVPNTDHGRDSVDLYKIPQPTSIDMTYEVKIFTNRINDLNIGTELFHKEYNAIQKYITVKGHPMPTKLESVSNDSVMDLEERKMFITTFEVLTQGYILDENDFEIVSTIDRVISVTEINNSKKRKNLNK